MTQRTCQNPDCGREPRDGKLRQGYCLACYKRLVWRPARGAAVERSDAAARHCKGQYFQVHGRPRRYARCASCQRFKSRPSSCCGYCGDDPVSACVTRYEYDRAAGWDDPPFP